MITDPNSADDLLVARLFAAYEPRQTGLSRGSLPAGVQIRMATQADADGIAKLSMQRNGISRAEAVSSTARWLLIPPNEHLLLVAGDEQAVVGYARVGWVKTPAGAEFHHVPEGWYLLGVVVSPSWRRQRIGEALTRHRLEWIRQRAERAYYFANSLNRASIDLHARLGFRPIQRDFRFPRASFSGGGKGILFAADLSGDAPAFAPADPRE